MSKEIKNIESEDAKIQEAMDKATADLSSYIQFLCEKYNADFIVQKVIFTFMPKMAEAEYVVQQKDEGE